MSIDDGMGGECRVCGTYHLSTSETICVECLLDALCEATKNVTPQGALRVIRDKLFEDFDIKDLYSDSLKNWRRLNKYLGVGDLNAKKD